MLEFDLKIHGRRFRAELRSAIDLAIRLEFDGPQPRFFAPGPARAEPLRLAGFAGTVAAGASCNCGVYTLAPHCHGTHTECVAHLTTDGPALAALTPVPPSLALLVSVEPRPLGATGASAGAHASPDDPVIDRDRLELAARRWADDPWTALVVRTLPLDPDRRWQHYAGACPAPYFTADALRWVADRGVESLVVDLPSLDRADDGGGLAAHRAFWGLPAGACTAQAARRGRALVTELASIPTTVDDGLYLLDLQVPAFDGDAAPSRPVLYPLTESTP
jgi:arylformamidase